MLVARLGPGEAGEDEQIGACRSRAGARRSRWRGSRPGRRQGAGQPGAHRRAPPQPGGDPLAPDEASAATATSSGRKTKTIGRAKLCAESCRRRSATSASSSRPPASSTERVRWASAPESRSIRASSGDARRAARRSSSAARRRRAAERRRRRPRRRAAGRSPRRRRRRSARRRRRRRRGARRRGRRRRRARGGARGAKPVRAGAGAGDDEDREQRLELVADPVEAHAEARVRPEQGERGQRRAGDDVGRVGEDRERRSRRPSAR